MHALKYNSETARLVRRNKAGSLPILAPAGTLRLYEVAQMSLWPALLFIFVLVMQIQKGRFNYAALTNFITWAVVILALVWPTAALFIYSAGIFKTAQNSVARSSAVIFWIFWPFWRLVVCIAAVSLAFALGGQLWFNNFRLYEEYYRLQAYDNVDAFSVTGNRLQDAGVVRFNSSDGVDRSKAACIKNTHTYCIAPIVRGGAILPGVSNQTKSGGQDLFMAGIDCCNCPVTDFRCGSWDDSMGKLGGMRTLDDEERKMFRLASDKWAVNFNKVTVHAIFFDWVNDPIVAWKALWTHGVRLTILYCVLAVFGSFLVMVMLNGFMRLLRDMQIAAPIDEGPPTLPGLSFGMAAPKRGFIPDEYRNYLGQQDPQGEADSKFVIL